MKWNLKDLFSKEWLNRFDKLRDEFENTTIEAESIMNVYGVDSPEYEAVQMKLIELEIALILL